MKISPFRPKAAVFIALSLAAAAAMGAQRRFEIPAKNDVSAAALDCFSHTPFKKAKGILLLAPGCNGDGRAFLKEEAWVNFARDNDFILVACSFRSPEDKLRTGGGYYRTAGEFGDQVAMKVKKIGGGRLPVFLYGFSGGAHFTANFAESHPQLVRGWCAASFDEKGRTSFPDDKTKTRRPNGIVACGADDQRLRVSQEYYYRGRAAGRQWTWLEVDGLGHERNANIEAFAREYFLALLKGRTPGVWFDIASQENVTADAAKCEMQTWLPDFETASAWRALCGSRKTQPSSDIKKYVAKIKHLKDYKELTMFLRLPSGGKADGVLCLSLLANSPLHVRELLSSSENDQTKDALEYAEANNLAVVAWGSRRLWDPTRNWDELPRAEAKRIDNDFDLAVQAWKEGIEHFAEKYGIARSGFLLRGFSASAQYAMRLAMRCPERFLAVHLQIPSSFDKPDPKASSILWCLTTGENEMGYTRSLAFFSAARKVNYPFIYKAYQGLGHVSDIRARSLGFACFDFARREAAKAQGTVDMKQLFAVSRNVADVYNQFTCRADEADTIPPGNLMPVPSDEILRAWQNE